MTAAERPQRLGKPQRQRWDAAAQEAITRQSRVQTTEIKRLRNALREGRLKPIVRMSRTMRAERLASTSDAMVKAFNVVGPEFIARGFASNFVEQLSTATKALRDAVDHRSAQVAKRTGTTAKMQAHTNRLTQLVGVIDTLVRPVIQHNPELLAAWENVVILPRPSKAAGGVVATPVESAQPSGGTSQAA